MTAISKIKIYADGACRQNSEAILMFGGKVKKIFGEEPDTINNRIELMAPIEALESLRRGCALTLYTDSKLN